MTYGLLRLALAFGLPLCTRLGSRFAVGTGHLCQIKFWLMQLMQTSWVSPAQACGSPRVALDQRRVSPFSRAMRAITVSGLAWAGLQAMVATSHFRQRLLRRAQSLTELPHRWLRWRCLRVRARLVDINGCRRLWESFVPFARVPDFVAPT